MWKTFLHMKQFPFPEGNPIDKTHEKAKINNQMIIDSELPLKVTVQIIYVKIK